MGPHRTGGSKFITRKPGQVQLIRAPGHPQAPNGYSRAFGDGPHNFESWSSDEDDIKAGTSSPNYHTTPTGGRLSSRQI
ncbi:hypothetical protein TNCV_4859781 [Trichonephila clavipes]|nr:hypothetical protein TNCV_4859781 [Trichonephila clavipes]